MLMSMNEYYFTNMDATNELPSWMKLERYYNCEDFFGSLHKVAKKFSKRENNNFFVK